MQNLFHSIGYFILTAAVGISSLFGYKQTNQNVGSSIPSAPSVFETYLANAQGSTDTTLTFASNSLRDGTTLSGYTCFTIDSNTSTLEYECGTVSGTTMTVSLRGIDAVTGATNIASLQFAHRVGADVKITDYPILTILSRQANGSDVYPNVLVYDPSVTNTAVGANPQNIASVNYVNTFAASGCANASSLSRGCVQLPTIGQLTAGTSLGSTGAALVISNQFATTSNDVAGNHVPITQNSGTIRANLIDQTATYNWSGNATFSGLNFITGNLLTTNASSTFTGTTTQANNQEIGVNVFPFIASTTITVNPPVPVFIASTTGAVSPSSANYNWGSYSTKFPPSDDFFGFAMSNATNNTQTLVQTTGIVNGFTGLTPGSAYYVGNATGTISSNVGNVELYVGTAISSTALLINKSRDMQYVGSVSGGSGNTPIPPFTRSIVVNAAVNNTTCDTGFNGVITLSATTPTAVNYTTGGQCATPGSNGNAYISANVLNSSTLNISDSGTSGLNPSFTAYFYR